MKILLLGEYSNVHATLARGLRALGHEVTVASNGDFWKNYPRDIDLTRRPGKIGGFRLWVKAEWALRHVEQYDVVQLINPMFLELKVEKIVPFYENIRKRCRCVVLGAMGMDFYWVHENCLRLPLRYSDFNIGNTLREDECAQREIRDWWLDEAGNLTLKARFNQFIASTANAIVAGLYEYNVCYAAHFPQKTFFIPMPIDFPDDVAPAPQPEEAPLIETIDFTETAETPAEDGPYYTEEGFEYFLTPEGEPYYYAEDGQAYFFPEDAPADEEIAAEYTSDAEPVTTDADLPAAAEEAAGAEAGTDADAPRKLRIFIGIQRTRSAYKGTDIMLRAAKDIAERYADRCELLTAENVPFVQYQKMIGSADVLLDQLYSYTPAMNALLAMSRGIVVVGGGEPENYDILGETELRPIINVEPNYESVFAALEDLVLHPEYLPTLREESIEYVRRHHHYLLVAQQYEALYKHCLEAEAEAV